MKNRDVVIIGAGPAGLCAAMHLAKSGKTISIIDRASKLGGQLVKQTHKFFGSEKQHAKVRGIQIATILINEVTQYSNVELLCDTTVVGMYPDKVVTTLTGDRYEKIQAKAIVVATGASEKFLAFENNDLPGIYGAGAVQTLMNVHGVPPGKKVLMVGSGNIGLIVSYQLLQAGVEVVKVIDASNKIGGYLVHASKLRRLGVPIETNTTIVKAIGVDSVEKAVLSKVDSNWNCIEGSETEVEVDAICIAVGLNPMSSLLSMVGVETKYVAELGGFVPIVFDHAKTTVDGVFACGDVASIEEASSAMVEGYIAGLHVCSYLGVEDPTHEKLLAEYEKQLTELRSGPYGEKTREGFKKLEESRP